MGPTMAQRRARHRLQRQATLDRLLLRNGVYARSVAGLRRRQRHALAASLNPSPKPGSSAPNTNASSSTSSSPSRQEENADPNPIPNPNPNPGASDASAGPKADPKHNPNSGPALTPHLVQPEPEFVRLQPSLKSYYAFYHRVENEGCLPKSLVARRGGSAGSAGATNVTVWAHPLPYVKPLSCHSAWITVGTNQRAEDNPELHYVPYFGDDDREDIVSEVYATRERQRELDTGPLWLQDARWDEALAVATELLRAEGVAASLASLPSPRSPVAKAKLGSPGAGSGSPGAIAGANADGHAAATPTPQQRIMRQLGISRAKWGDFLDDLRESNGDDDGEAVEAGAGAGASPRRAEPVMPSTPPGKTLPPGSPHASSSGGGSPNTNPKEGAAEPKAYEEINESFRLLLCRRCFVYDCQLHPPQQPVATLAAQTALALRRQWKVPAAPARASAKALFAPGARPGAGWAKPKPKPKPKPGAGWATPKPKPKPKAYPPGSQSLSLARRALLVCGSDYGDASTLLRLPEGVTPEPPPALPELAGPPRLPRLHVRRRAGCEIPAPLNPCGCEGGHCGPECACIDAGNFCSALCGCGPECPNQFPGCVCTTSCNTRNCPCFAAGIQCDPDRCHGGCGAGEPGPHPCCNDALSMQRQKPLLLAESSVPGAGWGLYTKTDVRRGEFVGEYRGEEVSQEEAERRGRVYDKLNRSYLFNLNSATVVDAARKGNKTRFANHSRRPNCQMRVVVAKGGHRIGMYAIADIPAQTELFFDYRYEEDATDSLNNLRKKGVKVDWMRDSSMASRVSKSLKDVYNAKAGGGSEASAAAVRPRPPKRARSSSSEPQDGGRPAKRERKEKGLRSGRAGKASSSSGGSGSGGGSEAPLPSPSVSPQQHSGEEESALKMQISLLGDDSDDVTLMSEELASTAPTAAVSHGVSVSDTETEGSVVSFSSLSGSGSGSGSGFGTDASDAAEARPKPNGKAKGKAKGHRKPTKRPRQG